VLAPHGRFVEIGKRDIFQNSQLGLSPFRNNLSFFAIDMEKIFHDRQHFGSALLREVMALFEQGELKPLPCSVFRLPDAAAGFRHLSQARNIGKVVVLFPEAATAAATKVDCFRPDRTYLITGGFGGLGTSLARWMVACGVRNMALLGRKRPPASVEEALKSGHGDDVRIEVISADISDAAQTRAALDRIHKTMPPLAGIVHAAGVLDDALLLHLNRERFGAVLAPKVSGAWNLHTATLGMPLDFFVLFSSLASVLGSPGQGNYAAGNAFLDALAHYRRAQDMPALSINWGPWAEAGMAAGTAGKLSELGIGSILPAQGLALFERLIGLDAAQAIAVNMDWQKWSRQAVFPARGSLFGDFQMEAGRENTTARVSVIRQRIQDAEPSVRLHVLESYMIAELARVLQLDAGRLDVHAPLDALGLDSLMAIEYKHRLDTELGVDLSIVGLLDGPTISQIASQLLEAVGLVADDGVHSETRLRETAECLDMFSGLETASLLNTGSQQEKAAGG
jgi:phthiocerol/phenolphthiocerol synthesis type-I polyketide synthase C